MKARLTILAGMALQCLAVAAPAATTRYYSRQRLPNLTTAAAQTQPQTPVQTPPAPQTPVTPATCGALGSSKVGAGGTAYSLGFVASTSAALVFCNRETVAIGSASGACYWDDISKRLTYFDHGTVSAGHADDNASLCK